MRRLLFLISLWIVSSVAFAQGVPWLNLEYTYTDFSNTEGDFRQLARLAGFRGELGTVIGGIGVSAGGEYQDGTMDFDGTSYSGTVSAVGNLLSKNYIRDTRLLAHYYLDGMVIAGGVAQREWYNNLVSQYHRRQTINYYPLLFTLNSENVYFKFEWDVTMKGKLGVSLSETGGGARDIDFTQDGGSGYMVEAGMTGATSSKFFYRVFVSYRRLILDGGGSLNDGVRTIANNKSTTDLISFGIGAGF